MTPFDLDDYFAKRLNNSIDPNKQDKVAIASADKLAGLRKYRQELEDRKKRSDASWAGKAEEALGIDRDGFLGGVINHNAQVYSGAARTIGNITAQVPLGGAAINEQLITQEDREAMNRYLNNEASYEDMQRLNRRPALEQENTGVLGFTDKLRKRLFGTEKDVAQAPTALELMESAHKSRQTASAVRDTFDIKSIVDPTRQEEFSDELESTSHEGLKQISEGWDGLKEGEWVEGAKQIAKGATDLIPKAAESILNNKQAVAGYLADNATDIMLQAIPGVGRVLGAVSSGAEASANYQEGLEAHQKASDGASRYLPEEEDAYRTRLAALGAAADFAGDVISARAVTGAARALTGAAARPAAEATKAAAREGFKGSLLNAAQSGARLVGNTASAAAGESVTEGFQTYAEGEAKGEPASAFDIYEGATIGAAIGGTLTGGRQTIEEAAQGATALAESAAKSAEERTRRAAENAPVDFARQVEANDPSPYLNPQSESYDPVKAVEVLMGHSLRVDATDETKTENLKRASQIVTDLEKRVEIAKQAVRIAGPEGLQALQTNLAEQQQKLAELPEDDTEGREKAQSLIARIEEKLASRGDMEASIPGLQRNVESLEKRLEDTRKVQKRFVDEMASRATPEQLAADIEAADAPVDPTNTEASQSNAQAAERVVTLAMAAPGRIDVATARRLADNPNNSLTEAQRTYLRRFSEAQQAQHAVKGLTGVHSDILTEGIRADGGRNLGIEAYRAEVGQALVSNDRAKADRYLGWLKDFAKGHQAKAKAVQAAREQFEQTGKPVWVVPNGQGQWSLSTETMSPEARAEQGAVRVGNGSGPLTEMIGLEAQALNGVLEELRAAHALRFGKPAKQVAPPRAQTEVPKATTQETESIKQSEVLPEGADEIEVEKVESTQDAKSTEVDKGTSEPKLTKSPQPPKEQQDDRGKPEEETSAEPVQAPEAVVEPQQEAPVPQDFVLDDVEVPAWLNEDGEYDPELELDMTPAVPQVEEVDAGVSSVEYHPGTLQVMQQTTPEGTTFPKRNAIADNLTQVAAREGDASPRPLVAAKDFLSLLASNVNAAQAFLKDPLTEKQAQAIQAFVARAQKWNNRIRENLKVWKNAKGEVQRDYFFRDMMQFLIQEMEHPETGRTYADVEENVKTAISLAVQNFLVDEASQPGVNSDASINQILGKSSDAPVYARQRNALHSVGTIQSVVVNSLGQRIVDALGFRLRKDGHQDALPRLQANLGSFALHLLMQEGYLQVTTKTGSELNALASSRKVQRRPYSDSARIQFYRIARQPSRNGQPGKPIKAIQEIAESVKGTQNVLEKLFGTEEATLFPTFEPVPFTQRNVARSKQGVPPKQAEVLEKRQQEPHRFDDSKMQVLLQLDPQVMLEIAGWEPMDPETTHVDQRKSIEARNEALRREYNLLGEFVQTHFLDGERTFDDAFYLEYEVWKQQRVGQKTNGINPQMSKLHRGLMYMPDWESTIKIGTEAHADYKIRIAENMGVKVDQLSPEQVQSEIETIYTNPEIQAGVQALQSIWAATEAQGDAAQATPEQQTAILTAVKAGGEGMKSFDALVALAQEADAQAQSKDAFTTRMMGEIDGVTNGIILSLVLFGASNSADALMTRLEKGGIFGQDSLFDRFNQFRIAEGNQDTYESTTASMLADMQDRISNGSLNAENANAIWAIIGELVQGEKISKTGRDFIKKPLQALFFGAGIKGQAADMAADFVGTISKQISKLAKEDKSPATLVQAVNHLLKAGGHHATGLPVNISLKDLVNRPFSEAEVKALEAAFLEVVEPSLRYALESEYATYLSARTSLNTTAKTTYSLYEAVKRGMHDALQKETTHKDAKGNPLHDITVAQAAAIDKRLSALAPVLHTLMSRQSNATWAGLRMAKTERTTNHSLAYKSEAHFAQKMAVTNQGSMTVAPWTDSETDPGTSMIATSVHSLDSAISTHNQALFQVLNLHDANGTGLATHAQVGEGLNQATVESLLNYSPLAEAAESLSRTLRNLAHLLQQPDVPTEVREELLASVQSLGTQGPITEALHQQLKQAKEAAVRADTIRLQTIAQFGVVDQYPSGKAGYKVPEAIREEAQKRLEALSAELTPAETKALQIINQVLVNTHTAAVREQVQNNPDDALDTPVRESAFYGMLPARALELLDVALEDPDLPADLKAHYSTMRDLLRLGQTNLNQIMQAVVDEHQQPRVVEDLSQRYNGLRKQHAAELGFNNNTHDQELLAALEDKGQLTAAEAIEMLRKRLERKDNGFSPIQKMLFERVAKLINPNLVVQYVTPLTRYEKLLDTPATAAKGWYSYSNSAEAIYVFSPEFASSDISVELLLHELTHAALLRLMLQVENSKPGDANYDADAALLVKELSGLLEEARTFVANQTNAQQQAQFAPALENVHEFVAWGLNNAGFIRDVLTKMQVDPKNYPGSSYTLLDGAKAFFSRIVGLVFGRKAMRNASVNSGYAMLVRNTAGLFELVAQQRPSYRGKGTAAMADTMSEAMSLDKQGILRALGRPDSALPAAFVEHLSNVLDSIVTALHGPFGAFERLQAQNPAITPEDIYQKATVTGQPPFASKMVAMDLPLTEQELFVGEQVEAIVREALKDSSITTSAVYREISKIFRDAYQRIKVQDLLDGDWNQASAEEQAQAERLYQQLFEIDTTEPTSDHLARFVGLALGSQKVNQLMQVAHERVKPLTGDVPLIQRLRNVFERLLAWFGDMRTGTKGLGRVDQRLAHLTEVLVDLDAKKKAQIARERHKSLDFLEAGLDRGIQGVRQAVTKAAGSKTVRESGNALVRAVGTGIRIVGDNRADQVLLHLTRLRDKHLMDQHGLFMKTMNYVRGPLQQFQELLRGVTKQNERVRKELIEDVAKVVTGAFKNAGAYLTKEDKTALTRVLLRADVKSLTGRYSLAQIDTFLDDPKALNREIARVTRTLRAYGVHADFYEHQAHALGYFLATDKATIAGLLRNAHNIAHRLGTAHEGKVTGVNMDQAIEDIDVLTTLYALHYNALRDRRLVSQILRTEMNRGADDKGNGIEQTLKMHQMLSSEALKYNFSDNPTQMQKGYTPEVYNPYTEVIAADDVEGVELLKQGFVAGEILKLDKADPNHTTRRLYVRRNAGPLSRVSGIVSITSEQRRGSRNQESFGGMTYGQQVQSIKNGQRKAVAAQSQPNPHFDPTRVTEAFMVPVFNANGEIAEYSYLMHASTKDTLLERNNAFDHLLGMAAGQSFDKVATKEQNRKALQAHQDLYEKEFAGNSEMFIELGPRSSDVRMQEIWRQLPHDTKQAVLEITGTDSMMIRKDLVDITFGYRKASVADIFAKDPEARNVFERTFVKAAEFVVRSYAQLHLHMTPQEAEVFTQRTAHLLRAGEAAWQEFGREIKTTIVIRGLGVLLGNIWSNMTLLFAHGMIAEPHKLLRWHHEAVVGLRKYQADAKQLRHLELQLDSGYFPNTTEAEVRREIALLKDSLSRNPVKPLIDDGLMPTIVEDVAAEEDIYSYKSQLQSKLDKHIQRVPKALRTVGKHVYMTKDTPQYQFLNHVTQLSDFMGRYTLHKYLTTKKNPMSDREAKQVASESFVNYDIPMPRGLQYLDDMIIVPFSKYFLSIQRVLGRLAVDHPARVLSVVLFNNYLDLMPTVMASSVIGRLGYVPVKGGVVEYPEAIMDSAMVSTGLSLVK